jgi:hypothetical protein
MNPEKLLREFLAKRGTSTLKIEKKEGSSEVAVFLCQKRIYKVGAKAEFDKEIFAYDKFKSCIHNYNQIFPETMLLFEKDNMVIWEVEFIGQKTLEDVFLDFRAADEIRAKELKRLNEETLAKIKLLFNSTRQASEPQLKQAQLFLNELLEALKINLSKAELTDNGELKIIDKIASSAEIFTYQFIPSVAHNDLTVGNIIVDDSLKSVRFIDPRGAVPYLEIADSNSNVVIDLTGYYVSVLRKGMELQKENPSNSISFIENQIAKHILVNYNKAFSPMLRLLCVMVWYSVYIACKCDYCTSAERLWLYEKMKLELLCFLKQLEKNLAG